MPESTLTLGEINDEVLAPLTPPRPAYLAVVAGLAAIAAFGYIVWVYQIRTGMGVAGVNHPVAWGVYIGNFVFWVGIAHSGTLISAILFLLRSRWRNAVSRAAEAMTVFAVMTAGLFPLIHLGRVWVVYYILPYPSQRQLWPDFLSPLVWDVCAISTYLVVSSIFWYVGLLPDLASARDRLAGELGPRHPRARLYALLALGWSGSGNQWRHYGRGYLYFAALATPLVVSVHSVVSWDFATGILPGWHTTIFPPYFVAGAIHSGLAMVLTLLIPMRRLLRLERLIRLDHFEAVAQTMLVTTAIVAYAYVVEPFIAWYSGDEFERAFAAWRAAGWIAPFYWALPVLNVIVPLAFAFRRVRRNLAALFVLSLLVNVGMWLERAVIVVGSTSHDFLPHNWGPYTPTWVEWSITAGPFGFFLFFFFVFAKGAPTISMSDLKESQAPEEAVDASIPPVREGRVRRDATGVLAVFARPESLLEAIPHALQAHCHPIETYSPMRLKAAEALLGRASSPVRLVTLSGALLGLVGGFALAIGSALVNRLIAGGKPPVSIIPYCIIAFEGTVLLGSLANLGALLFFGRLGRSRLASSYDPRFSRDRFGLFVACAPQDADRVRATLDPAGPEEVRVVE